MSEQTNIILLCIVKIQSADGVTLSVKGTIITNTFLAAIAVTVVVITNREPCTEIALCESTVLLQDVFIYGDVRCENCVNINSVLTTTVHHLHDPVELTCICDLVHAVASRIGCGFVVITHQTEAVLVFRMYTAGSIAAVHAGAVHEIVTGAVLFHIVVGFLCAVTVLVAIVHRHAIRHRVILHTEFLTPDFAGVEFLTHSAALTKEICHLTGLELCGGFAENIGGCAIIRTNCIAGEYITVKVTIDDHTFKIISAHASGSILIRHIATAYAVCDCAVIIVAAHAADTI